MDINYIMNVDNIKGRIKNDESLVTKEGYLYLNGIIGIVLRLLDETREKNSEEFYKALNDGEGVIVGLVWEDIVSMLKISAKSDYNTPEKFKDIILTLAVQVFRDEYHYDVNVEAYTQEKNKFKIERLEVKV